MTQFSLDRGAADEHSRSHGTSIYLQALKGESSDTHAEEAEWKIVKDGTANDIQHACGKAFKPTRDAQQLAENIHIDWSLRSYMEVGQQTHAFARAATQSVSEDSERRR